MCESCVRPILVFCFERVNSERDAVTDAYVSSTVLVWIVFELDKKFKYIYQVEKMEGI